MNNDLISREALLKELRDWGRSLDSLSENCLMLAIECTCEQIEEFPAVDAEPVRHGRWLYTYLGSACSACGYDNRCELITRSRYDSPYCPNCGAKMDGGKV